MISILFTGNELRQRRRETIANPPEGVVFRTLVPLGKMRPDFEISKTRRTRIDFRRIIRAIISLFRVPNIRYVFRKNLKNVDLIYTPGQMLLNKSPYIIEIENIGALGFYSMETVKMRLSLIGNFLKKDNCRALICLSEASRTGVINTFKDAEITKKCHLVYPLVKLNSWKKDKNLDKVILLSCNTKFYMKGTREVLLAFEELRKMFHNIELWIVSNTPAEYIEKYKNFNDIKFFPAKYSKEELCRNFYSQCDIFVQPSYQDSLGMTYLEVAASGKPIVCTDIFATPEVVIDKYNGFLIPAPFYNHNSDFTLKSEFFPLKYKDTENEFYKKVDGKQVVRDLIEKTSVLIEDENLRQKMGDNSLKIVADKFNLERRNRELKAIFEEASRHI